MCKDQKENRVSQALGLAQILYFKEVAYSAAFDFKLCLCKYHLLRKPL